MHRPVPAARAPIDCRRSPSSAPSRSAMPCSPVPYPVEPGSKPRPSSRPRTAIPPVRCERRPRPTRRRRTSPRSAAPRAPRSRRPPRRPAGSARCRRRRTSNGHRGACGPATRARQPGPCRQAAAGRCRARGRAGRRAPWPCPPAGRPSIAVAFAGSRSTSCSASRCRTCEGDELLLGAVMDVPLELAPLVVLGRDEPLLRGPQVQSASSSVRPRSAARARPAPRGPATSCSRVGSIGSFAGIATDERPQQLALVADLGPTKSSSTRGDRHRPARSRPGRSSSPTASHTAARSAPTPSPSTRAVRGSTSSVAYVRRAGRRTSPSPRRASRACRRRPGRRTAAPGPGPAGTRAPRAAAASADSSGLLARPDERADARTTSRRTRAR